MSQILAKPLAAASRQSAMHLPGHVFFWMTNSSEGMVPTPRALKLHQQVREALKNVKIAINDEGELEPAQRYEDDLGHWWLRGLIIEVASLV